MKKAQGFYREYPYIEAIKMQAEVEVVVDERLQFRDASYGELSNRILQNRYALGKTGTPYDLYLRFDLDSLSSARYKLVWLKGFMQLTEKESSRLMALAKTGRKCVVNRRSGNTDLSRYR